MWADFRYALRTLRRAPGFAATAVLILALGIGANTALFSVLQATVLRALPYPQAGRLVDVSTLSLRTGRHFATSWLDYQDWQRQSHAFTGLAAYTGGPDDLVGTAEPLSVTGILAARNFFQILGVGPEIGRLFSPAPRTAEAVISDPLWRSEFGSNPNVLGRQVSWGGIPVTIVGVVPAAAGLPHEAGIWLPADLDPDTSARSAHNWNNIVGRLRPGISAASAQAEMTTIAQRLAQLYPDSNQGEGIAVTPLQTILVGDTGLLLWLMLGAAGLVLLIACANLANLYLVRATSRQRETALRLALGASRARLVRQWATEGWLLALAGGGAGLWLAGLANGYLSALMPPKLPGQAPLGVNWTMALFAFALALITAVLFAAAPVLQALPQRLIEQLKQGGALADGGSRRQARTRQVLVIGEVALAMVVVAGAGLLLRSVQHLESLPLGFQPEHRVAAQASIDIGPAASNNEAQLEWERILANLRANPEFHQVGLVTNLPLVSPWDPDGYFEIAGRPLKPYRDAYYHVASPGYFAAMGIPLLRGRDFTATDTAASTGVAVMDQTTARLFFPGQNPLGQRLRFLGFDAHPPEWLTVVGIVGDTQFGHLRAQSIPQIYTCLAQHTDALAPMGIVAMGPGGTAALSAAIRNAVHRENPKVAVTLTTLDAAVAAATAAPRLHATLLGAFAGLAWVLAVLGIYGVVAQEVLRRRRELGIRIALGARPDRMMAMVLRQGLVLALAGIGCGLLLALAATRLLASFLFETSAADPATLAVGAGALLLTALAAGFYPARRASRIPPAECLRAE